MRVRRSFANNIIEWNPQGRSTVQLDHPLTLLQLISISPSTSRTIYPNGCSVVAAIVYPKNVFVVTVVGYILLLLSVHTSDNIILLYKHSPGPMEVVSQGHLPCVRRRICTRTNSALSARAPTAFPHTYACVCVCTYGWCVYMCVCDEMCRHVRLSFAPATDAAPRCA